MNETGRLFGVAVLALAVSWGCTGGDVAVPTEKMPEKVGQAADIRTLAHGIVEAHYMWFPTEADRSAHINMLLGRSPDAPFPDYVTYEPIPDDEAMEILAATQNADWKRFEEAVGGFGQAAGWVIPDPTCSYDLTIPEDDEEARNEEQKQWAACLNKYYDGALCTWDYKYEGAGRARKKVAPHLHCEVQV